MLGGPLVVLLIVGYVYQTGGRYVSTDHACVKADKVNVAAEVTGNIASVAVAENQHVEKGQPLFRLSVATASL